MISKINQIYTGSNNKKSLYDAYYLKDKKLPIVIFCHGFKGFKDWGCFDLIANKFIDNDFAFLKFNFSHNGGTLEQPIDFPDLKAFSNNNYSHELNDVGLLLDEVEKGEIFPLENIDLNKIYLIGHSRGGGIAVLKTAEDSRIKKLVTLAGVSDFSTRFGAKIERFLWRIIRVHRIKNARTNQKMPIRYDFYKDYQKNEKRLNIPKQAKQIKVPTLIINGLEDDVVLPQEGKNLNQWISNSTLIELENENHTFGAKHPWEQNTLPKGFESSIIEMINFFKKI